MPKIPPVTASRSVCLFVFTLDQAITGMIEKANMNTPPYIIATDDMREEIVAT